MSRESGKRRISVFISSPGDLSAERKRFRAAINQLNVGFADGANVVFEPLGGWDDTPAPTGRRRQRAINREIDRCDVFILTLHRRWGQKAPDAAPYSSYTEQEFHRALERRKNRGSPEIFVLFKRVDAGQEADAGPQLQKILAFRRLLEETGQVIYRCIDDGEAPFIDAIDRLLRAYAKGERGSAHGTRERVVLPLSSVEEVGKAREKASFGPGWPRR